MIHNVRIVQRGGNFTALEEESKTFPKKYKKSTTFHALMRFFVKE